MRECGNLDPATIQLPSTLHEADYSLPAVLEPFLAPLNKKCEVNGNIITISSPASHEATIYYDVDYFYEGAVLDGVPHGSGRLQFPHAVSVEAEFVRGVCQPQGVIRTGDFAIEAELRPWSHFQVAPIVPFVLDPTAHGIGPIVKRITRVRVRDEPVPLSSALWTFLCMWNLSQSSLSIELDANTQIPASVSALDPRVRASFAVNTLFVSQEQPTLYAAMARMMVDEIDCWNGLDAQNAAKPRSLPVIDSICALCSVRSLHFYSISHPVQFQNALPPSVQDCSFSSSPFVFAEPYLSLRTLVLECSLLSSRSSLDCSLPKRQTIHANQFPSLESLLLRNCQTLQSLLIEKGSLPQCRSLSLIGCRSLQHLTIQDDAMVQTPGVFGVLELTDASGLKTLFVGSRACRCVGELNLNSPELESLHFEKESFRDASILRISTAFMKEAMEGSMVVEDDAFPTASLIVEGRNGEGNRG